MQNIADKVEDGGATAGGRLGASEYNNHKNESQNVVARSGQSFSAGSEDQLSIAAAIHGIASGTFVDSGTANTVEITPATGASGILLPTTYTLFEGAKVSFYSNAANTGATTLNIGQTNGTLLGAKKLWRPGNIELIAGDLVAGRLVEAIFDSSLDGGAGAWVITDTPSLTGLGALLHVAQIVAPTVQGGTSLATAFQTRVLDTVITNNIPGASLATNTITLPAGRYWVDARAPGFRVSGHQLRIVDTSGPTTILSGPYTSTGPFASAVQNDAVICGILAIASTTNYQVSHYTELATAANGLGLGTATGDNGVLTEVRIWRL